MSSKSVDGEGPQAYQRRVNAERTPEIRRAAQQRHAALQARRRAVRALLLTNGGEFPDYASSGSTVSQASVDVPAAAEGAVLPGASLRPDAPTPGADSVDGISVKRLRGDDDEGGEKRRTAQHQYGMHDAGAAIQSPSERQPQRTSRPLPLSRTGAVWFGETTGALAGQREDRQRTYEATHWSPTKANMTADWVASMALHLSHLLHGTPPSRSPESV